jgi:hypothetical protein
MEIAMSKVLILGCGPAGLMAAHAASMQGSDVIILSKKRKSFMRGAQYLHRPIPAATTGPAFLVSYLLRGSADAYRAKVYGPDYRGSVSPEDLTEAHTAWDIRQTYDWLWETYGAYVINTDLDKRGSSVNDALHWAKPDFTISTIPAKLLCESDCAFTSEEIWSNGMEVTNTPENTVICNGEKAPAWYRSARIQGHITVEWPNWSRPPMSVHNVVKPLKTNCNCQPSIVRMGRYGKWSKGVLSHSAFFEAAQLLQNSQLELPLFESTHSPQSSASTSTER